VAAPEVTNSWLVNGVERIGRSAVRGFEAVGFGASLFVQSAFWVVMGRRRRQPVRSGPIFSEMMEAGVAAIPIVSVLSLAIGLMLAIQGINALAQFGAEQQVTFGVAISVTREFAPLITGIVVAGRSGSALAARIGTMMISSEVDALRVMGISPVRFLVVPSLVGMLIMVPCLSLLADFVALFGAGLYISGTLGMTLGVYSDQVVAALKVDDVTHGLIKALIFGGLTALVGVVNGANAKGGAEGVGRATTRAVVQAIAVIIVTDMIFTYATTR
jgi:phospholipid/cholesterol/gamma-HCH transport system permease protein